MDELVIKNLHVKVEDKEILKGVNLTVSKGEILALLGPNGHGKSTLFSAIMGNPKYKVSEGEILFNNKNLLSMEVDERSKEGLFLAFQNPYEIPGLISADFYKSAMNARSEKRIPLAKFYRELESTCKKVNIPFELVNRNLNDGFSGGEKKRNEILQMLLLKPSIAMLDEIDSWLDVDAINIVSECINNLLKEQGTGYLVISHYARLFDLIHPTRAAVMINGRIVCTGGPELIKKIDEEGYQWIAKEYGISIEKEDEENMNKVSIGACAVKEISKDGK